MANNGVKTAVKNNLKKFQKGMEKDFEIAMLKASMKVHNELIKILSGGRSGKMYKVPGTMKRKYQASSPGEAPASRLGHLRNSYQYIVKGKGLKAVGYVGSNLEYSHYLEYGTYKMKPRPHLKVAFMRTRNDVQEFFKDFAE